MKNLVLIGMPGSGKTKIGRFLSQKLHMPLLDTDQLISTHAELSIPEIFSKFGEGYFRELETQAVKEAASMTGVVIATGGGAVLREENMAALSQTGIIFFRDRPPEAIVGEDHQGRPLIGGDKDRVFQLYEARIGLYKRYAHHYIPPTDTWEEAANIIGEIYRKEEKS